MPRQMRTGADFNGQRLLGLGDPTAPMDGVNLQFLRNFINGLSYKATVRAGTTQNISVASPGATFDGVALVNGDRVLVKDQTTKSENGVYIWNGATSPLVRATDADSAVELQSATVVVAEGTSTDVFGNRAVADKAWLQITDNITLGTSPLAWIPLPGAATIYSASNGIRLVGTDFQAAVVAGGGVLAGAAGLAIDTTVVPRKFTRTIGDGTATVIDVVHPLNTLDLSAEPQLRNVSTGALETADYAVVDSTTVRVSFAVAPAAGGYRISITG